MTQIQLKYLVLLCMSTFVQGQQVLNGTGKCTEDFQCVRHQFCLKHTGTCEDCTVLSKDDTPKKCRDEQHTSTLTYGGCRDDGECPYGYWCHETKCFHCDELKNSAPDVYLQRCGEYAKGTEATTVDATTSANDVSVTTTQNSSHQVIDTELYGGVTSEMVNVTRQTTTHRDGGRADGNMSDIPRTIDVKLLIGILFFLGAILLIFMICIFIWTYKNNKYGHKLANMLLKSVSTQNAPREMIVRRDGQNTVSELAPLDPPDTHEAPSDVAIAIEATNDKTEESEPIVAQPEDPGIESEPAV